MNPVIKSQTAAFQEKYSLNNMGQSEAFEAYTIFSVISGQLSYSVDPLMVHLRGNEFGLDGVGVLIQGKLAVDTDEAKALLADVVDPDVEFLFFQSKTGNSYEYGDIGKTFDGVEHFFNDELIGESDQLDDLIAVKDLIFQKAVTRRNPGIRIYYATTGAYEKPDRTENLLERRIRTLKALSIFDQDRMHLEMLGAEKLQTFYRSAIRSSSAKIEFPKQHSLPKHPKVQQGYVGYIEASEIVKMVATTGDDGEITGVNRNVFFDNIRDYNEKSTLNKKIGQTLREGEGHDFVYRNNGITVIAKSILRTSDDFTIEDFQIVNGCQTANIIFQNRDHVQDVAVPFRLIGSDDDRFVSSIIIGTNSQNQVKEEQFLALLPFVKDLEEYARSVTEAHRVFIERREHQYQDEIVERARIMPIPVLMKAVSATILGQPNRSPRDYKKLYKDNTSLLFSEHSDVQIYHAIAYLYYRLEFLWRNNKIDASLKIFRYYLVWAIFREATRAADFTKTMKTKVCQDHSAEVIAFASDEEKFKAAVQRFGSAFLGISSGLSAENREKLRDAIRSETVFQKIRKELDDS
ncbi:MAG: AIPR family protein [Pseudomonadota bacterium]